MAAAKAKAAPIARPSADYQWKIDNREYGGDEKERREEARLRESEERRLAREAGHKVDLGEAARYWEQVAQRSTVGKGRGSKGGQDSKGGKGKSSGKAAKQQTEIWQGSGGHQRQEDSNPWSRWSPAVRELDPHHARSGGWNSSSDVSWATGNWAEQPSGNSYQQDSKHSDTPTGDRWEKNTWAEQSVGTAAYDPWAKANWAEQPSGDSWKPDSAPADDRWIRNTWTEQSFGNCNHDSENDWTSGNARNGDSRSDHWQDTRNANSSWDQSNQTERTAELGLCRSNEGMDDCALKRLCDLKFPSGTKNPGSSTAIRIDLSGNRLTDEGIDYLASCLQRCVVRCKELLLEGNCLKEPWKLANMLKDKKVGLKADLGMIALSSQVSASFFWRILEACFLSNPRPPLHLCFDGELSQELCRVIEIASEKGLSMAICTLETAPCDVKSAKCLPEHKEKDIVLLMPGASCDKIQTKLGHNYSKYQ